MQILGQENDKVTGEIRVEIKSNATTDKAFILNVPVYQKIVDSIVKSGGGFYLETSNTTCTLNFGVRAVKEKPDKASITFYVFTEDTTKNHTFTKKIKLRKGERKSFDFKPGIDCLNVESYSINTIYS